MDFTLLMRDLTVEDRVCIPTKGKETCYFVNGDHKCDGVLKFLETAENEFIISVLFTVEYGICKRTFFDKYYIAAAHVISSIYAVRRVAL